MTLGQRIQELRKGAGLSQEGLGEALGVSRQAVSKWEGDNGIPELDTLIAMSRLFGVTLGQLLGVEEREQASEETPSAGLTEERVEEILRRYAQENKAHQPAPRPIRWQLPLAAGCLLLVLVIVLFVQLGIMRDNMNGLQRQLNQVQSDISSTGNQISNIYYRIGEEIRQQLEAQANVVDTFEYEVTGFDLEQKTVELSLSAALRSYDKGTVVQFVLDSEAGQVVSGEAVWPEFAAAVTVPMHHHVEVRARITGEDGTVREQQLETLYSLTEDSFVLYAESISAPVWINVRIPTVFGDGSSAMGSSVGCIMLYSDHTELLWPEEARWELTFNGEVLDSRTPEFVYDSQEMAWRYDTETQECMYLYQEGKLTFTLTVTDNFGRVQVMEETWYVSRDGINRMPTPVDPRSY